MNNTFVWMIYETQGSEEAGISGASWRCEQFNEEGKVNETTGSFVIASPIPIEDFASLTIEEMRDLIFANVDKEAVEAELQAI